MTADSDRPTADSVTIVSLQGHATGLVGREREIAEVKRLLTQTRLLTLSGAGGCGKTRLARRLVHVAQLLRDSARYRADFGHDSALADPAEGVSLL